MLTLALMLAGCKMAVDGEVTDVTGGPIEGATVTLASMERSQCQTLTDAEGKFQLPCATGTYTLYIGASGYLDITMEDLDANERKRHDVGKQMLVTMPTDEGLLLFNEKSYTVMSDALLERTKGGDGQDQWKHYCMPEDVPDSQITRLPPANHAFFDNESKGWRAWILDEDGCAYKMAPKSDSGWEKTYGQTANHIEEELSEGKTLVLMELPAGRYFIANWDGGFFNKSTIGEDKGYIGHYLVVQ